MGLDLDAERALKEEAKAFKKRHGKRGGEALCEAFGRLSTAEARYAHGQRVVRERALLYDITPQTRWLWDCIYPRPYASWVERQRRRFELPAGLTHAVMRQESAFRPLVSSPVGAMGLMQLMPNTAKHIRRALDSELSGEPLTSPPANIELGSYYLGRLLTTFKGNVPLTAGGYNAGPTALKRWLEKTPKLPLDLFLAKIPYRETRNYVARVVGNWARYRYLSGGITAVPVLDLELPSIAAVTTEDY